MKHDNHVDLNDLYRALQIIADGFLEAIMMLSEVEPQRIDEGIASCDRWLEMVEKGFNQFKTEVLGGNYAKK